jgi:ribosomal protein S18 acetylase RimI-like enzyme
VELPAHLYDEAVALWHETGLTRPWNDPAADLRRAVEGCSSTVLCSFDGELQGTALVGHDGHRGWVYYLAVRPGLQRRGIGRSLMLECEEWLRARGVPKLQLMVRQTNPAALGFYERLGYVDAETVVLGRFL